MVCQCTCFKKHARGVQSSLSLWSVYVQHYLMICIVFYGMQKTMYQPLHNYCIVVMQVVHTHTLVSHLKVVNLTRNELVGPWFCCSHVSFYFFYYAMLFSMVFSCLGLYLNFLQRVVVDDRFICCKSTCQHSPIHT